MPSSFEYQSVVGIVARKYNGVKIYNGVQSTIFDAENNRVRINRINKIFLEPDYEMQVYDFQKMRLLTSDPSKGLCLKMNIADLSPVSMMPREHENIEVEAFMLGLWASPVDRSNSNGKTQYLGEYDVQLRSTLNQLLETKKLHVFVNDFSFLHLEQDYVHLGGVNGA